MNYIYFYIITFFLIKMYLFILKGLVFSSHNEHIKVCIRDKQQFKKKFE